MSENFGGGDGGAPAAGGEISPPAGSENAPLALTDENKTMVNDRWRDAVDPEYGAHASTKDFQSLNDVLKSYVNQQKLIGGEKLPKPNEKWGQEDWTNLMNQLGRPTEATGYNLNKPENAPETYDYDANKKWYGDIFHKANLTDGQSQVVWNALQEAQIKNGQTKEEKKQVFYQEGIDGLKKKYGDAYPKAVDKANYALSQIDKTGELKQWLNKTGLSSHPVMIEAFISAGQFFSEDSIANRNESSTGSLTPKQYEAKANAMLNDKESPLNDKRHPQHEEYVKMYTNHIKLSMGVK